MQVRANLNPAEAYNVVPDRNPKSFKQSVNYHWNSRYSSLGTIIALVVSYLHRNNPLALKHPAEVLGLTNAALLWVMEWLTNHVRKPLSLEYKCPVKRLTIAGYPHPIYVRLGSSDARVIEQVFVQNEYAALADLTPDPRILIDCGGNIGCSALYFLNRYRALRAIVVEPDSENVVLCRRNLAPYADRVTIIEAGVWSRPARLVASGGGWGTRVREAQEGEPSSIEAVDLPILLSMTPVYAIDLLKIDIEWSELELFRDSPAWLSRVRNIAIELHDQDCERVFFNALNGYYYDRSKFSDLTICRNIHRASSAGQR